MKILDIKKEDLKRHLDLEKLDLVIFDSLEQYAGHLYKIKDLNISHNSSMSKGNSWYGTEDFDEALDLILRPNKDLTGKLKLDIENIENKIKNNLQKKGLLTKWIIEDYHYNVEGIELDIGKLIEGDPNCYLVPNIKYKDHFYDLHLNYIVSSVTSTEVVAEALSKVVSVIKQLDERGYKLRIFATGVSKRTTTSGRSLIQSTIIKHYDELLCINKLARVLHPSFQRRLSFKFREDKYGKDLNSEYGQSVDGIPGIINLNSSLKEESLLNSIVEQSTRN